MNIYKLMISLKMKYIALLVLFICIFTKAYGEERNLYISSDSIIYAPNSLSFKSDENNTLGEKYDYNQTSEWKKYKTLRTLGWCSLGVGVPITTFGIWLAIYEYNHYRELSLGAKTIAIGGTFALASIPLFISSRYFKNKSQKLVLNMGLTQIKEPSFCPESKSVAAIDFVLCF